ncbi:MAG: lipocalin family protein [Bacteroidetes bacterium]|nr:lipocalin family protein [Bacteroidota bacterium]
MSIACNNNINEREKLIVGKWQAVSWLANGQQVQGTETVSFSFDSMNKYNYANLEIRESGSYKIENDMLFTTPSNQQEMMVKIIKITKDSLIFGMNRSGKEEQLTLLKK